LFVSWEDGSAFFGGVTDSLVQEVVDLIARVGLDVDDEDHCDQNSKDNDSVDVTGQESSLKTTTCSVENDTPGDQERSPTVVNTGQSFNSGGTTKQKHGCYNKICAETEEQECLVGSASPTSVDDLTNSVGRGSDSLERDSKNTKKNDLDGGTRGIPEGSRDTVLPGNVRRLQKGSGPCPLRNNHTGCQPGLDHTSSSAKQKMVRNVIYNQTIRRTATNLLEMFTGSLAFFSEILVSHDNQGCDDTE
jgi:hypothetical protein